MATTTPQATSDSAREDDQVLRLTRHLEAPRALVYQAFTDPIELARWWGPEGVQAEEVELDVRPGGRWRNCMVTPKGDRLWVGGVYREVAAPERLVFTWVWEHGDMAGVETVITIILREDGAGTELTLFHEGISDETVREHHQGGWSSSIDCLVNYLA